MKFITPELETWIATTPDVVRPQLETLVAAVRGAEAVGTEEQQKTLAWFADAVDSWQQANGRQLEMINRLAETRLTLLGVVTQHQQTIADLSWMVRNLIEPDPRAGAESVSQVFLRFADLFQEVGDEDPMPEGLVDRINARLAEEADL